ncbi:NADPH-dependent glutamate synthase beta subunit-like oxidoreductase, partial [Rhodococcus sp. UYP5]
MPNLCWGIRTSLDEGSSLHMTDQTRPLRVAIVGAGPAGIYAADALMKSDYNIAGRG